MSNALKEKNQTAQTNRLLTTMAIARSNADTGKDYISNFEPFAIDCLKAWPSGDEVGPESLSAAICAAWGVPPFPTAVGKILLSRAEQQGHVTRLDRALFPNAEQLAGIPGLVGQKQDMLAGMNALADALVQYARSVHQLDWSVTDATSALERLADEFGAELAVAKGSGGLSDAALADDVLTVVYGFARSVIESDPVNLGHLEELVQGTMLVNAMYFPDIGHVSNKLKSLRVYFDTTPVLRAMGLADEAVSTAANELLDLLRDDFKVRMFVFPHTVDEIRGVLGGIAHTLRRGTSGTAMQADLAGRNREAIDALVRKGVTAGEVEGWCSETEALIRNLGIGITDAPPHREKGHVNEERFDEILSDVVEYRSKGPREKDLKSLTAIDRLRGASRPPDLSQANALFVTANPKLVRASHAFFEEEDHRAPVPHAMHETAFTAQLWVRAPHPLPDLPRKLLIADCYAALNPPPELWERWVRHIIKLREQDTVTEEQVQNLIYHEQARSKLFEVTHGDPTKVNDEAVTEVLERFEAELRKPGTDEARDERERRERAEAERDELLREVEGLKDREKREHEERRRKANRRRTMLGYALALLILVGFALVAIGLGLVHGKFGWAASVTTTVFGATAAWTWGVRRNWKLPFTALIFVGAVSTLFFNILSLVPAK